MVAGTFHILKISKRYKKKIKSFAHSEHDLEKFTNLDHIKNSINNHKDLFNRAVYVLEKVKIDNTYPDFIINNKVLLKDFIL